MMRISDPTVRVIPAIPATPNPGSTKISTPINARPAKSAIISQFSAMPFR
jgi:hypothetical protein